jgi:hypothetical protein
MDIYVAVGKDKNSTTENTTWLQKAPMDFEKRKSLKCSDFSVKKF